MGPDAARALLIIDDGLAPHSGRALARAVDQGSMVRVRRSVYVESAIWQRLTKEERLLLRVLALSTASRSQPVFSHWAAAVLLGLPVPRRATDLVDLAVDGTRNRTIAGARVHRLALRGDEVVEIHGLLCTSATRTAVDVAADCAEEEAVVLADAALATFGPEGKQLLRQALDLSERRRGAVRAERVIEFADGRSGSPGESISRFRMHRLGFVAPELQVRFETDGFLDIADFGWEAVAAAGEFDGEVKYRSERYRRGRSVEDVVIAEKNRENRIRRRRPRFARWDWSDLQEGRLDAILRRAGIPKRDDHA